MIRRHLRGGLPPRFSPLRGPLVGRVERDPDTQADLVEALLLRAEGARRDQDVDETLRVLADALEERGFARLAHGVTMLADASGSPHAQWVTRFRDLATRIHRAANVIRNDATPAGHARALERRGARLRRERLWEDASRSYDAAATFWHEAGDEAREADANRQGWGIHTHHEGWIETRVIFRKFPKRYGEIIALFPDIQGVVGDFCHVSSYMHVGGHGAASPNLMRSTKSAKPAEYRHLFDELTRMGYDLIVIERFPRPGKEREGWR